MKVILLCLLLFPLMPSCAMVVSPDELKNALQENSATDQEFAAQEDARVVEAARAEGVPLAAWTPGKAEIHPPPLPPNNDWFGLLTAAVTVIGGGLTGAGIIRYQRGPSNKKKQRQIQAPATSPTPV